LADDLGRSRELQSQRIVDHLQYLKEAQKRYPEDSLLNHFLGPQN
ncbi:MAG: hypothetical protein ACI9R3_003879, partial [Verrucomicrobiales bacterium]